MMQGGASCRRYAESRTVQLIVIAARRNGCAACGRNERMREIGVDRVFENGAPGTIRTSDPQIRSLMLYPAELRARFSLTVRAWPAGSPRRRRRGAKERSD